MTSDLFPVSDMVWEPPCHVTYINNRAYVVDKNGEVWIEISHEGSNVKFKLFPNHVPSNYIGERLSGNEELVYSIVCNSEADAVKCQNFLADLINTGYGDQPTSNKKSWLIGLDLQDIVTEVFSSNTMFYHGFLLDSINNPETISNFCRENHLERAKTFFICVYQASSTADGAEYEALTGTFCEELNDECSFWQQWTMDDTLKNEIIVHVLYS